jgi:hypothetical protein
MLIMLVVAAAVVLGLGAVALIRSDPPEVSGWLRAVFGTVFGIVAVGFAAVIGIPSGVGLWAMAGANAEGAVPALPPPVRTVAGAIGIATIAATVIILVVTGSAVTILNVGLAILVGLAAIGLAGAVTYSPHRFRAVGAAIALVLVALGTAWVLRFFLQTPA